MKVIKTVDLSLYILKSFFPTNELAYSRAWSCGSLYARLKFSCTFN
uniref:Uncharacterized protein n=1 Tax=Anguilla anguilla TaxID=7936 RepID=A0A0E9WE69_ANGAN